MDDLDQIDNRLLTLLRQNSRMPTSALARELGISRSTVQDRLRRLERRNIIEGYTIAFSPGFRERQISAHVMIQVNPKHGPKIVEALSDIAAVRTIQTVSGLYDLVTTVETATTETMDQVLDAIGQLQGVEKTTTSIVLSTKLSR